MKQHRVSAVGTMRDGHSYRDGTVAEATAGHTGGSSGFVSFQGKPVFTVQALRRTRDAGDLPSVPG